MFSSSTTSTHQPLRIEHRTSPVASTQDEARQLLHEDSKEWLAVIADEQTQGRGTQGRRWEGGRRQGNLYLTLAVPMAALDIKLTLLPLQIAVEVAKRVDQMIRACNPSSSAKTTVKWPNDVLVNDAKVSGTLIENTMVGSDAWFLIGIGVNVAFAPNLTESPGKQVRGATCVAEHCEQEMPRHAAAVLGNDLASGLVDWITDTTVDRARKERQVIDDWRSFAEFGKEYELRGHVAAEDAGAHEGERVVSVDIMDDGQLLVRGANGRERLLIADYMF